MSVKFNVLRERFPDVIAGWGLVREAADRAYAHVCGKVPTVPVLALSQSARGCGSWGCVFTPRGLPGWVLKVTEDPFEARAALAIMADPKISGHPGVVHIGYVEGTPAGAVILEEKLLPLTHRSPQVYSGTFAHLLMHLENLAGELNTELEIVMDHDQRVWHDDISPVLGAWWARVDYLRASPLGVPLADFLELLFQRHGLLLYDVKTANLGVRTRDPQAPVVLLDVGHSFLVRER